MALHDSIRYENGTLMMDALPMADLVAKTGTPVYLYSLKRALHNLHAIRTAYSGLTVEVHYSAKANGCLAVLRALIQAGAGIDAVSAGEIHRALTAGATPQQIVFAGVGKTPDEIRYAVGQGVGWFNVENVDELHQLQQAATDLGRDAVPVALRLNPEVTASTHPYIATGHGGAKFGLTAEVIRHVLAHQAQYPRLRFGGLHVHIGSQLGDTAATVAAVSRAQELLAPYPALRMLNIGGGMPAVYRQGQALPAFSDFAAALRPLLRDYHVILEPGRAIIADAGVLVTTILYVKKQAGQTLYIVDAGMTELIRPALYEAVHEFVPLRSFEGNIHRAAQVVGPVCESSDVLGQEVMLPELRPGDRLAILTAGAYGMVMASNYNARPRPPEVVVTAQGNSAFVARARETWEDLLRGEV